jgi:hypothetical protein
MPRIKDGEYVLATKYRDGDPKDQWAVGFLKSRLKRYTPERYAIVDGEGMAFRNNGFRRIERLTHAVGKAIVANSEIIEQSSHSLWWWKRKYVAMYKSKERPRT